MPYFGKRQGVSQPEGNELQGLTLLPVREIIAVFLNASVRVEEISGHLEIIRKLTCRQPGWAEVPTSSNFVGHLLIFHHRHQLAEMNLPDAATIRAGHPGLVAEHLDRFSDLGETLELLG
jgi:hypothetical protein